MEKIAIQKSRVSDKTIINITRYGNVMNSRGSVIPLFINQMLSKQPITITNPDMTRFMMSLEEAVNLVLFAFKNGKTGEIFVQKSPATTIKTLVLALKKLLKVENHAQKIIGMRHGEKLFETLLVEKKNQKLKKVQILLHNSDVRDLNYNKFMSRIKISKSQI